MLYLCQVTNANQIPVTPLQTMTGGYPRCLFASSNHFEYNGARRSFINKCHTLNIQNVTFKNAKCHHKLNMISMIYSRVSIYI